MAQDIVQVMRVIVYRGKRTWVEDTVARSIQGTKVITDENTITAVTIDQFPQIIEACNGQQKDASFLRSLISQSKVG